MISHKDLGTLNTEWKLPDVWVHAAIMSFSSFRFMHSFGVADWCEFKLVRLKAKIKARGLVHQQIQLLLYAIISVE